MKDVSVIMPIYPSAGFSFKLFSSAVNNIISQKNVNLELIPVIDGGGQRDKLKPVFDMLTKKCIKTYVLNKNYGAQCAMNFGFTKSSGRFVAFHDQDDISDIARMNKSVIAIEQEKDMVGSFVGVRNGKNFKIKGFDQDKIIRMFESGIVKPPTHFGTLLLSKDFFSEVGGFENVLVSDSLFCIKSNLLRYYGYGRKLHLIEEPLFTWTKHAGSNTHNKRKIFNRTAEQTRKKISLVYKQIIVNAGNVSEIKKLLHITDNITAARNKVLYKVR